MPAHPVLAAQQQRSGMRRFLDAALGTEGGLRFLLVFVVGALAGLWAVVANAGVVAEGACGAGMGEGRWAWGWGWGCGVRLVRLAGAVGHHLLPSTYGSTHDRVRAAGGGSCGGGW
jgi:hypothetical protein